jgi:hypothetical protein
MVPNKSYSFMRKNFSLLEEYFSLSGWEVNIRQSIGVIYLRNVKGRNKANIKSVPTKAALLLRLMYEEKKTEARNSNNVCFKVNELVTKMLNFRLVDKRPNDKDLKDILKFFRDCNAIIRLDARDDFIEDVYIIMPVITVLVPDEKINALKDKIGEEVDTDEAAE